MLVRIGLHLVVGEDAVEGPAGVGEQDAGPLTLTAISNGYELECRLADLNEQGPELG